MRLKSRFSLNFNSSDLYLDDVSCALTCPFGFKLKKDLNIQTCDCKVREGVFDCQWTKVFISIKSKNYKKNKSGQYGRLHLG